jgi:hypothetical protein
MHAMKELVESSLKMDMSIGYESSKIKEHERNYATHDLEFSAIFHALKMWRHYLMGKRFELKTYHFGLKYLFE